MGSGFALLVRKRSWSRFGEKMLQMDVSTKKNDAFLGGPRNLNFQGLGEVGPNGLRVHTFGPGQAKTGSGFELLAPDRPKWAQGSHFWPWASQDGLRVRAFGPR